MGYPPLPQEPVVNGETGHLNDHDLIEQALAAIEAAVPYPPGGTTEYLRADGTWDVPPGSSGGVSSVAAADTSVVVTPTTGAVTVRTNTPDVIFTDRPPAASVPMNSQKFTGLANGTASSDSAAFGQIPTALPPNGSASGDLSGTYPSPSVANAHLATQSVNTTATLSASSAPVVLTDTSSAAFTLTLPASPTANSMFVIVDDTGHWNTHNLTIGRNGKNIDGAASNLTLASQYGKVWLYYDGTAWWTLASWPASSSGAVVSVTAGDTSIVVGGTSANPTIETATPDVIFTDHPPAASVPMNSQKLTGLANGTASSDAAAFGQIPVTPISVANGGTGDNSLTAYALLAGGTTSTGAVQSLAGVGTSGQQLISNGASALPTFQSYAVPLAGGTMTGWLAPAVVALTDAATILVDADDGNDFRVTLGGNRTLGTPSNPTDGQRIIFQVSQPSSGGPYTLGFTSAYEFSTSLVSPTLSTGASLTDLLGFIYNATKSKWLFVAFVSGFS